MIKLTRKAFDFNGLLIVSIICKVLKNSESSNQFYQGQVDDRKADQKLYEQAYMNHLRRVGAKLLI